MNYPYEFTIRQPGIEISVRTEKLSQLANTHDRAQFLLEAASQTEQETAVFRYSMPTFLSKKNTFIKQMNHYEQKYPGNSTIDFSIELTSNVTIDETEAGVSFALSDEQINKAHTMINAQIPPGTREMWIITHGNIPQPEAERLEQRLSLSERVRFEHYEADLGDVLRIVVFCFLPVTGDQFT